MLHRSSSHFSALPQTSTRFYTLLRTPTHTYTLLHTSTHSYTLCKFDKCAALRRHAEYSEPPKHFRAREFGANETRRFRIFWEPRGSHFDLARPTRPISISREVVRAQSRGLLRLQNRREECHVARGSIGFAQHLRKRKAGFAFFRGNFAAIQFNFYKTGRDHPMSPMSAFAFAAAAAFFRFEFWAKTSSMQGGQKEPYMFRQSPQPRTGNFRQLRGTGRINLFREDARGLWRIHPRGAGAPFPLLRLPRRRKVNPRAEWPVINAGAFFFRPARQTSGEKKARSYLISYSARQLRP